MNGSNRTLRRQASGDQFVRPVFQIAFLYRFDDNHFLQPHRQVEIAFRCAKPKATRLNKPGNRCRLAQAKVLCCIS